MNISEIFLRRPIMTSLVMLAILLFGILAFKQLPVSDLPNVNYPVINVSTDYPGASPQVMADNLATPLEKEFATIQGLQSIASTSTTGTATIVLQFSLDKSIDVASQDVQAAINRAQPQLPQNMPYAPTYNKTNPTSSPVIYLSLTSATMTMADLYDFGNTVIGKRLSLVDGVAQVTTFGAPYAVRVQVNPQKLAAKKIGINDVGMAIQNANVSLPTGTLFGPNKEFTVNVGGQMYVADKYNNVIIKNENGSIVRLSDVGRAFDSLSDDKYWMKYFKDDINLPTVTLAIQTQPGTNTLSVVNGINAVLPDIEKNLPGAVQLHRLFDRSEYINEAVRDVEYTLLIAFGLVVIIIFFYLGKVRDALIPTMSLPLTVFGTFIVMSFLGYAIDILSLLAITLSIGFLVDDAIVVLENIVRHVEQKVLPFQAALVGSKEISFTILSMTLCLASIFIPLLFMGGIVGKLFHEFAVVIVTAVLISGFISLSLTPMLCSRFIPIYDPNKPPTRVERLSHSFNTFLLNAYQKSLEWVLRHRKTTLAVAVSSLALSIVMFKLLPKDFLPPDDMGFITAYTQSADGTSPFQMSKYQAAISDIAIRNPYIDSMVSIGAYPDDNKGLLFIRAKPYGQRPPLPKIIHDLREQFGVVPGVQTYMRALPLIDLEISTKGNKGDYQYTMQSLDPDQLYKYSNIMLKKIKDIPGFFDVATDLEITQPQLNIEILRDRAYALNINAQDIEYALQLAYSDSNLSPINFPQNQYYVIMEVEPKFYKDPLALSQIYLRSSTGQLVPFNAVTKMDVGLGPLSVNHFDGLASVNITFNLPNLPLGSAIKKIDRIARETLPPTVTGKVEGSADVFRASFASMNILIIITIFLIYIILGILYENFFHPITVLSTLPPAALGALLTLFVFRQAISLYALVGMILLLGIVMKNGIILIDFANDAILRGKNPHDAIKQACITRFRPILMTTFCALMGSVPIALGLGGMTAQGRRSLGLVIIGGLLFSQVLTLYFTPVVYLYLENLKERLFKKKLLTKTEL